MPRSEPRRGSVSARGGSDAPPLGRRAYEVDLVLDARLFGRFRLLSIEAAVDVVEPVVGGSTGAVTPGAGSLAALRVRRARRFREGRGPRDGTRTPASTHRARPARHHTNGAAPLRRADAESILGDAERTLGEQG